MKTVALIASHNRDLILRDCIECIKPQVDDIVLVGSSEWVDSTQGCNVEKKVAKDLDLLYVDHSNKVLGRKFQAGLDRCRLLDPDAVLICGSDDLIADDYLSDFCGNQVSGVGSWYVYDTLDDRAAYCSYRNRKDPLGAGRVIPSRRLEAYNWDIFPYESGIGCDQYSYARTAGSHGWENIGGVVLSVKGDWPMMDTYEQIVTSLSLTVNTLVPSEIESFLNTHFPLINFEKYRRKHGS